MAQLNDRAEDTQGYIASNVAMMRFCEDENEIAMRDGLLDYFFGTLNSLEFFNHWRYPICNSICDFEKETQNMVTRELSSTKNNYLNVKW